MQTVLAQKPLDERLLGWWYRIAAPPNVSPDAPLRDRERVRVGKLTSATFLIEFIFITMVVGTGLSSNHTLLYILIGNYIMLTLGTILNRRGYTFLAGMAAFLTIEGGMILNIINASHAGGLSPFSLPLFDTMVQAELIAVTLFPAWTVLLVAALNSGLVWWSLTFLPKTPELVHILTVAGYNTYQRPIAIEIITALVTFLWVSSALQEMKRANSIEEVNKLTQALAIQQQAEVQEKQLLEANIKKIIEVHVQVANGNLRARVPLDKGNILWPIAGSLNNLLARLQRWRLEADQLHRTEHAIEQMLQEVQMAKKRGEPIRAIKTGTALDPLMAELAASPPHWQPANHS
jgi:hypothetical protein